MAKARGWEEVLETPGPCTSEGLVGLRALWACGASGTCGAVGVACHVGLWGLVGLVGLLSLACHVGLGPHAPGTSTPMGRVPVRCGPVGRAPYVSRGHCAPIALCAM